MSPARASKKFSWESAPWLKHGAPHLQRCVGVAQDANEEWRSYMEDGHKVVDPLPVHSHVGGKGSGRVLDGHWRFFAVYDGHGGRQAMEWLETHLHHAVATELQSLRVPETGHYDREAIATRLTQAFKKVDGQLASLGAWKYGSTATVALIHDSPAGKALYVANVGDSRAVLIGGPDVKQLSVDHHASNPVEAARVEQDGGIIFRRRVCGSLSVTRAFGDHELKGKDGGVSCVPDVSACKLLGARALVIATDGVWDVLDGFDVQEILEDSIWQSMQKDTLPKTSGDRLCGDAAQALVDCAKSRGSHDNICALVAFL